MGLFDKLFGSKQEPTPISPEELTAMHQFFTDRKYAECIQLARKLLKRKPNREQKEEIDERLGLAYFQNREYNLAYLCLEPLTRGSQEPGRFFNLATTAIMAGLTAEGLKALDNALLLYSQHPDEDMPPPAYMNFFAMQALLSQKAFPEAFQLLKRLFALYAGFPDADSQIFALHGTPPLEDVLSKAMGLFFNRNGAKELLELRECLNTPNQELIDSFISQLQQAGKWPL